ncbi:MAG: terminase small subunit [Ignavibacteriaceae bacterium]
MAEITNREKLFLLELLADTKLNPEKAALKAGYSKNVARTKAYLWVSKSKQNNKPHVKEMYDKLLSARIEKLGVTIEKIEAELIKIAFSNLADMLKKMDYQISLEKLRNLNDNERAAISEISEINNEGFERKRIKVHAKLRALELLGKRYKMWTDESEPIEYIIRILNNGEPADF